MKRKFDLMTYGLNVVGDYGLKHWDEKQGNSIDPDKIALWRYDDSIIQAIITNILISITMNNNMA